MLVARVTMAPLASLAATIGRWRVTYQFAYTVDIFRFMAKIYDYARRALLNLRKYGMTRG
jgi:hypothetical protein